MQISPKLLSCSFQLIFSCFVSQNAIFLFLAARLRLKAQLLEALFLQLCKSTASKNKLQSVIPCFMGEIAKKRIKISVCK